MIVEHKAVRAIVLRDGEVLVIHRNKYGRHYYTLVGGGVEPGEDNEAALRRELREETSMEVGDARLVFIEKAGEPYGTQYIYLCEYIGGEPVLQPESEEAAQNRGGQNIYEPQWLPLLQLKEVVFRSDSVRDALLAAVQNGFPEAPQTLAWRAEDVSR